MSALHFRRFFLLAFIATCNLFPAHGQAASHSWIQLTYHAQVPQQTREHAERCLDIVAELLTEYEIYLPQPISLIVTADTEGYIQTLMSYGYSRADAEIKAANSAGVSLNQRPVILIKGTEALFQNQQEIFRVLPHEIFHQVQRQWGRLDTVTWLVEGAPELFRIKALSRAGFGPEALFLILEEQKIRHGKMLPSALQLGSKDYHVFSQLAAQKYPVYAMSTLMLNKLVEDVGFEKLVYFYQLLHHGVSPEKAFQSVFRVPMGWFLKDMDIYFQQLVSLTPLTGAASSGQK